MKAYRYYFLTIVLSLFSGTECHAGDDLAAEYQKLQVKLKQQTNPVGKTKVLIKMSDIDLKEATQHARKGDLLEADQFLLRYVDVVRQAGTVLKTSQRNAQKNPAGFREFEIALHHQLRKLNDLEDNIPYDQQQAIEKAKETARIAQQEMLLAIFGADNLRPPPEQRPVEPKRTR